MRNSNSLIQKDSRVPVRPHQVGQRDVSFTTPEANMSLKSNQRISQKVTRSCSLTRRDPPINVTGATRIQRNPISRSKLSLHSDKEEVWQETRRVGRVNRENKGGRAVSLTSNFREVFTLLQTDITMMFNMSLKIM